MFDLVLDSPTTIEPNDESKDMKDASFVGLAVSFDNISNKKSIKKKTANVFETKIGPHQLEYVMSIRETVRVTYSVELTFGETKKQRHGRVVAHQAGEAAKRGLAARDVAEHGHFAGEWTPADEQEERKRQRVRLPSLAAERERHERKEWVQAYITYTFEQNLDKQYVDAVRYLKELDQRGAAQEAAAERPAAGGGKPPSPNPFAGSRDGR